MSFFKPIAVVAWILIISSFTCAADDARKNPKSYYRKIVREGNFEIVKLDVTGDKVPDIFIYYTESKSGGIKRRVIVKKAIDLNGDGRVDITQYFTADEKLRYEEIDLDYDGKIELYCFYENGQLVRKEYDLNNRKRTNVWKFYENNILVRVESDTNDDGKIDYWEYYENGRLERVGRDLDGDGKVDTWQKMK